MQERRKLFALVLLILFPIMVLLMASVPNFGITTFNSNQTVNKIQANGTQTLTTSTTGFHLSEQTAQTFSLTITAPNSLTPSSDDILIALVFAFAVILLSYALYFRNNVKLNLGSLKGPRLGMRKIMFVLLVGLAFVVIITIILFRSLLFPPTILAIFSLSNSTVTLEFTVFLTVCLVILALRTFEYWIRKQEPSNSMHDPSGELLRIIQSASDRIEFDLGDPRSVIIDCYKQLLTFFSALGIAQKASLTPREFETEITYRLGASSTHLKMLTELFERAKYSDEELSNDQVTEAKESLKQIGNELKDVLADIIASHKDFRSSLLS